MPAAMILVNNDQPNWYKIWQILGGVQYGSPYKRILYMQHVVDVNSIAIARTHMRMAVAYALSRVNANVEITIDGETRTFANWTDYLYNAI